MATSMWAESESEDGHNGYVFDDDESTASDAVTDN